MQYLMCVGLEGNFVEIEVGNGTYIVVCLFGYIYLLLSSRGLLRAATLQ